MPEEEAYDHYRLEAIDRFTNMLRRSFFTSLYSFLETQLVKECRSRKSQDTPLSFSEIAGQSDIEKAKIYFAKVLRVYFPSDTPEWQEIQHYRLLRNCLVHNQGRLDDTRDYKALREYAASKNGLSIQDDEIYLGKEFCKEANQNIKAFLCLLLFSNRGAS